MQGDFTECSLRLNENLQKLKLKKFVSLRGDQPKRNAKRGRELVDGSVQLINRRKGSINIQIVQT